MAQGQDSRGISLAEQDQIEAGRQNRNSGPFGTFNRAARSGQRRADDSAQQRTPNFRQAFDQGLARGRDFSQQNFVQGIQPRIGQALDLRQQFATQGLGAPALAGARAGAVGGINQQLAQNLAAQRAQQGASGVRGAAAGFQAQRTQQDAQNARAAFENQLLAQDVGFRSQNLGQLQAALGRERFGDISSQLGFGGLGIQQAAAGSQAALGNRFLDISQQALQQSLGQGLNPTNISGGGGFGGGLGGSPAVPGRGPSTGELEGTPSRFFGVPLPGNEQFAPTFSPLIHSGALPIPTAGAFTGAV